MPEKVLRKFFSYYFLNGCRTRSFQIRRQFAYLFSFTPGCVRSPTVSEKNLARVALPDPRVSDTIANLIAIRLSIRSALKHVRELCFSQALSRVPNPGVAVAIGGPTQTLLGHP